MRRLRNASRLVLVVPFSFFAIGCRPYREAIVFSKVPVADAGGPDGLEWIKGRVLQAKPDQRVVLYAHSVGLWYLQPASSRPFTEIKQDLTWESVIHLGDRYAALLVGPGYIPTNKMPELPTKGGSVLAINTVPGTVPHAKTIHFSGYNWEARQKYSNRDGKLNPFDPANAWVDRQGFLHLKVVSRNNQWFGAEVNLQQSLGHGRYHFTVRDVSHLDSAAVLTMYTWGYPDRFNREVDVEVSRFGDPEAKSNAQFVVQPYYEPSNISHFEVAPGFTTFSFHWEPGAILFDASRGLPGPGDRPFASHRFDSGVPDPGGETVRISLYAFGKARIPMKDPTEVIVESFSYSP